MAYTSVLANRYAEGLLRVVRAVGHFEEVGRELHAFLDVFEGGGELHEVMLNPAYNAKVRRECVDDLVSPLGLSKETANFLRLLIQKRRIQHLPEIVRAYDDRYRAELGIIRAEVLVAEEVDTAMQGRLESVVSRITGKKPELAVRHDPSIIGGIKILMGNTVLDASIKTKLERLREKLTDPSSNSFGEIN
jgi:F-type H+-transporting ATPase subunit delta